MRVVNQPSSAFGTDLEQHRPALFADLFDALAHAVWAIAPFAPAEHGVEGILGLGKRRLVVCEFMEKGVRAMCACVGEF